MQVARRAAAQWGVLSLAELRECGLSPSAVRARVRRGWLHRIHSGVYAVGHPNVILQGRFLAAVKACGPTARLSHRSAAALFGFVDWDERRPEVTIVGTSPRVRPGLRVHRTSALGLRDMLTEQGIPVTSPARTLLDLASQLTYRPFRRAVRQAHARRRVSVRQLAEVLARPGPRCGRANLARIVATGQVPTRSELEDAVLELIVRGGLASPDVNVPLQLDGRRVIPDFRWREQRLIVEADGAAWHDSRVAREDDAERQALLELHGERVLRVTWAQAIGQPRRTLARMIAAGAPPARRPH